MGAIRTGETPPATPTAFPVSMLEDTLQANLDAVRRFEGPTFVRPLPANSVVPATSHKARIHLRAQVELLLSATDEMADSLQHAPMLLELGTRCKTAQRVLQWVTQVLENLIAPLLLCLELCAPAVPRSLGVEAKHVVHRAAL